MKAAAAVLAVSAVFLAGVLTGFARDDGGGSAPGLVELGDDSPPATEPSTTTTAVPSTAPPTAPPPPPSAPPANPPPVTIDDDHEEIEHDVAERDLDDFDDHSGPGGGDDDSGPGGGDE